MRPSASKRPHEKSSISRMIGEKDERYSTTAISSAMPAKACESTSCVTGSRLIGRLRSSRAVPAGPAESRQPGGTTMVESSCSTIAGPVTRAPAPRSPRS